MKPSQQIIDFCKSYEKFKAKAYMPTPNDRPTLGYGATFHLDGTPVKMGETITEPEAAAIVEARLQVLADQITLNGKVAMSQQRLDAIISLCDNIGYSTFKKSRTGQMMYEGKDIGDRFKLYDIQAGKILKGLTLRRAAEANIYKNGVYVNHD